MPSRLINELAPLKFVRTFAAEIAFKANKALDTTGKTVMEGIDNAGRKVKVKVIAAKNSLTIEKAEDVLAGAIIRVMDVWSTTYLTGIAFKFGMGPTNPGIAMDNIYFATVFESFDSCLTHMTTFSAANAVAVVSIAAALKIDEVLKKRGNLSAT